MYLYSLENESRETSLQNSTATDLQVTDYTTFPTMKTTRAAALLGLLFLVCFSDIVSGQRWASCGVYRMSDRNNLACPRDFQPVCGTDNVTYPNECSLCREIFRNRVIDKKHDGRCIKVDCTGYMRTTGGRESLCTRHYNPFCATNGVTYSNKCSFCTAVANGEDIDLFMPGKCPKLRNSQIDCSGFKSTDVYCTAEYMPLCGSDGRTYGNKCHFCIAVLKSRGSLTLKHRGKC